MGAGAGATVDETFVFQRRERLTNGVAGDEELACQILLTRQAIGITAGMDLVSQDIGNQARLVGAGSANRRRFRMMRMSFLAGHGHLPGLFVV